MAQKNLYTVEWLDDYGVAYDIIEDLSYKQMVHYIDLSDRQKQLECLDILSNLPVYLLECNVSYEAFLTCYKGVFNKDYEN